MTSLNPKPYFLACILSALPSLSLASFPDEYDHWFQYSAERFTQRHWTALKAQGWQESRLKPHAVSPADARGVMQFTARAWGECQKALGFTASPHDPKFSIICGGWYMARMDRIWNRRGRTPEQVWPLALGSYNAGAGSLIKAQQKCDNALLWQDIAPCLHLVTGQKNSKETIQYVILIPRWMRAMNP